MAFDHRTQFEAIADRHGTPRERICSFKRLALEATLRGGGEDARLGVLIDGRYGRDALDAASGSGIWIARPIEEPGSVPLRLEGGRDAGTILREWPVEHVVKCLVHYHPDDDPRLRREQEETLLGVQEAARATRHELLVEVIARGSPDRGGRDAVPRALARLYAVGLAPDWWKLAPPEDQTAWDEIAATVAAYDPHCRGVLLLGFDRPMEELASALTLAARQPVCRGFAVGRTLFGEAAERWFAGRIDDEGAIALMQDAYRRLLDHWALERTRHGIGATGEA